MSRLMALWVVLAAAAGQCWAVDFSADMVGTATGGKRFTGKYYQKGNKSREEVSFGDRQVLITRGDRRVAWVLIPAKKEYSQVPASGSVAFDVKGFLTGPGAKEIGKEVINGFTCRKLVQSGIAKGGKKASVTVWYSDRLKRPVKLEQKSGAGTRFVQLKNVRLSPPADSLFELPKGYRKVAAPGKAAKGKR